MIAIFDEICFLKEFGVSFICNITITLLSFIVVVRGATIITKILHYFQNHSKLMMDVHYLLVPL